jgi:hypothetical protein
LAKWKYFSIQCHPFTGERKKKLFEDPRLPAVFFSFSFFLVCMNMIIDDWWNDTDRRKQKY